MHAHLFPFPFETRYWRWSPYSCKWTFFNGSYFSPFHLSISLKWESPTVAQCEAVIVSVPFCPMHSPAFCMWKDPERRRERWINTQTAFCLHHFGFCCHETLRHRHADNRWGRGEERRKEGSGNFKRKLQHPAQEVGSTCWCLPQCPSMMKSIKNIGLIFYQTFLL